MCQWQEYRPKFCIAFDAWCLGAKEAQQPRFGSALLRPLEKQLSEAAQVPLHRTPLSSPSNGKSSRFRATPE